ncbi:uncharacterized protein METZ01_LOCUS238132 [marine metagenome]|uniref:Uncharacterized protein n=1 Tax=marine metagenome TaxID=408172 RepID=A0A382HD86_9ZZZZ
MRIPFEYMVIINFPSDNPTILECVEKLVVGKFLVAVQIFLNGRRIYPKRQ